MRTTTTLVQFETTADDSESRQKEALLRRIGEALQGSMPTEMGKSMRVTGIHVEPPLDPTMMVVSDPTEQGVVKALRQYREGAITYGEFLTWLLAHVPPGRQAFPTRTDAFVYEGIDHAVHQAYVLERLLFADGGAGWSKIIDEIPTTRQVCGHSPKGSNGVFCRKNVGHDGRHADLHESWES